MMRLYLLSDVHLESRTPKQNEDLINRIAPAGTSEDAVLAILGDLAPMTRATAYFFKRMKEVFRTVVYVPGNHEYWSERAMIEVRHDLLFWCNLFGVHVMDRSVLRFDNDGNISSDGPIALVAATLWTAPTPIDAADMHDFKRIHLQRSRLLTPSDMAHLHQQDVGWFERTLEELKDVPVRIGLSHHAPSTTVPRGPYRPLTAYTSHCDHLVKRCTVWAYGHTHVAVHKGNLLSNPLGRRGERTGGVERWGIEITRDGDVRPLSE